MAPSCVSGARGAMLPISARAMSNRAAATRAPVAAYSSSAMPRTRSSFEAQPLVSAHTRGNLFVRQAKKDGAKEEAEASSSSTPKVCREAIDLGLELYQEQKFAEAIAMWQKALELPGSGAMRLAGTVREFSCPSTGEENSALYNMACAYSQLKQQQSALTCIQGVLDNGFDDFEAFRTDPDLAAVQGNDLEAMIAKFETPIDKIGRALGVKKSKSSGTNKPWLIW